MTVARPKIVNAAWHMLPEPLRGRLRGNTGRRFVRFVPVSMAAVAASQSGRNGSCTPSMTNKAA